MWWLVAGAQAEPLTVFERASAPVPPGLVRVCERVHEGAGGTERYELWASTDDRGAVERALTASFAGPPPWTRPWSEGEVRIELVDAAREHHWGIVYDCVPTGETRTLVQASAVHRFPEPPPPPVPPMAPVTPARAAPSGQYPGLAFACDGRMYGTKGEHAMWEVYRTSDAAEGVATFYGLSPEADGSTEGVGTGQYEGWELHVVAPAGTHFLVCKDRDPKATYVVFKRLVR